MRHTEALFNLRQVSLFVNIESVARLKPGQMLHGRGDATRAAPHLRKAMESTNARIHDAANQLLTAK